MLRKTKGGWKLSERPSWRGEAGPDRFSRAVLARLKEDPRRLSVIDGDKRLTRQELYDQALRLGSALWRRGLRPGSVVSFQLPNWFETCAVNLACALYGFAANPLLAGYRENELRFVLEQCQSEALFIPGRIKSTDFWEIINRVNYPAKREDHIFHVRRENAPGPTFDALLKEDNPIISPPEIDPNGVKLIIFTSGSTGHPKGVLHSHESIFNLAGANQDFWGLSDQDILFVPSPVAHIGGSIYAFDLPWTCGCPALLMDAWDPLNAVQLIEREGASFCAGATPFLQDLLQAAEAQAIELRQLRRFVCGGASVPANLIEKAAKTFPNAVVHRAYGSSEVPTACPGIRTRAEQDFGAQTDGEAIADIRILDAQGREVASGEPGEIFARSPAMFIGYIDTEDEAGQLLPDGFFRMGDLGRFVEGRYLIVTGRTKDIIIRNGENISPPEVENILLDIPAIAHAAVVGVPDERTGERAVACVVLNAGYAFSFADMQEALKAAGLARYKHPEELRVMSDLPVNTIGKVIKEDLKARLRLERYPHGN
jgi:acyl-CoA synthetase (AMP-forming)/AMP-acid ligase II